MHFLYPVFLAALLPSAHVNEIPASVLTEPVISIADAEDRLRKAAGARVFFRLEGKITARAEDRFVLRDATGAVFVMVSCDDPWQLGDSILLAGTARPEQNGGTDLFVEALSLKTLSHGQPETPVAVTPATLARSDRNLRPVCLSGTITDAFRDEVDPLWNILILEADGARAAVWLMNPGMSQKELKALVEAVVSIDGISFPRHNGSRRYLGSWIQASSKDSIHILTPAPADPFSAAELPTLSPQLSALDPQPSFPRRNRLSGTVVAIWGDRRMFLKAQNGSPIEVRLNRECTLPPIGTRITVSGFVRNNIFYPRLSNALLRIDGDAPCTAQENPTVTTPRQVLFDKDGEKRIQSGFNGKIVRVSGCVRDAIVAGKNEYRIIMNSDGITVPVIVAPGIHIPEVGSEIEVTGACLITTEAGGDNDDFVRLEGMSVIVRGGDDIVVLRAPSWWTAGRLMAVIGTLLMLIVAILAWNISLRIVAVRRARQLFRAQADRLKANMKVEERTRLAVELHDSLSQTLTGIALLADSAARANEGGNPAVDDFLDTVRQMLASCRRELQGCLWDLRSRTFEEKDLSEAVTRTISPNVGDAKVRCRFDVPRQLLSETTMHAVLRIVRELVVNAVRHGKASEVRIAGEYRDGLLRFSVADNGQGFNPDSAAGPQQGHFGLQGVRERINDFNGSLAIESAHGKGTKVSVLMKVKEMNGDG